MDLHGLPAPNDPVPPTNTRSKPTNYSPGIWQCRKIAVGYLTQVCPEFREIQLSNGCPKLEDSYLDISLMGGLCLFGRLQHLERFSSGTWKKQGMLNTRNLEWIVESRRSEDKKKRQKYFKPIWKSLGLLDDDGGSLPFDGAVTIASQDSRSLWNLKPERRFGWSSLDPTLRKGLW
ncbi:hypothetical protein BG015_007382 [Linnemannia schmuckeri]|uniref:Uncharacterized protein n=1 Tax=Linnemannia schmuckeri TaxID=64567 RepID=A0A9P5VEQ0_9FUNG|nr:hypothetical protein BG015_007382 [Linnemannia schmuckeri]